MNCFDCSTSGRSTVALGLCSTCGAGVCADHVEFGAHELPHTSGPGNYTPKVTRTLTCSICASVLSALESQPHQPAHN